MTSKPAKSAPTAKKSAPPPPQASPATRRRRWINFVIVCVAVFIGMGASVIVTGKVLGKAPEPSPVTETSADTIPHYDHTRIDRIVADLRHDPVTVSPELTADVPQAAQAKLAATIRKTSKPIYVAVTPINIYDESRGDYGLMANRLALATGKPAIVIVTDGDSLAIGANKVKVAHLGDVLFKGQNEVEGLPGKHANLAVSRALTKATTRLAASHWTSGPAANVSEPTSDVAVSDEASHKVDGPKIAGFPVSGYVFGAFLGLALGGLAYGVVRLIYGIAKAIRNGEKNAA